MWLLFSLLPLGILLCCSITSYHTGQTNQRGPGKKVRKKKKKSCQGFIRLTRGTAGKWFCVVMKVNKQPLQVQQKPNTFYHSAMWSRPQRISIREPQGWFPRTRTASGYQVWYTDMARKPRGPDPHGQQPYPRILGRRIPKDCEPSVKSRVSDLISSLA